MDLAGYKALSFDCYGTLIDWEAGIAAVLVPWADEVGLDLDADRLLAAYAGNKAAVERDHPSAPYPEVLATAFRRTGETLGRPVGDHFRALLRTLDELGIARGELLHVAQSLFHDHVPARKAGLASVWINRRHDRPGWGATPEPSEAWSYNLELSSLAELAAAADAAFAGRAGLPGPGRPA
jgi:FMN phosphatase YigB (HAD superfamily)